MQKKLVDSIPYSKSILIRLANILQYSQTQTLSQLATLVKFNDQAQDFRLFLEGIHAIQAGQPAYCGLGAAPFRFLTIYASRIAGKHLLTGEKELFQRPHYSLLNCLEQLGATEIELLENALQFKIQRPNWENGLKIIQIQSQSTSQVLSALLLNAWNLPFDLEIKSLHHAFSNLTIELCKKFGMKLNSTQNGLFILKNQTPLSQKLETLLEPDASLLFTTGLLELKICEPPVNSLQPDSIYYSLTQEFNNLASPINSQIPLSFPLNGSSFIKCISLETAPDLFPSFALLAALATGKTEIKGIERLPFKESNRLSAIQSIFKLIGIQNKVENGTFIIEGKGFQNISALKEYFKNLPSFSFHSHSDHRIVFVLATLQSWGATIQIQDPHCVEKSFPSFWEVFKQCSLP